MSDDQVIKAVNAALSFDWESAVHINQKILAECPDDVDCLNRLGKAYLETGDAKKAATTYRKVLKLSKYNPIAQRNLERALSQLEDNVPISKTDLKNGKVLDGHASPSISPKNNHQLNFIEEPGKTRLVPLVNIASIKILLKLNFGDIIKLVPKRHSIFVYDQEENYIGALPDDLAHRLSLFLKGGNTYEGFIKSVSKSTVTVFLREVNRSRKFHNTPSFPASGNDYFSFVREETLADEAPHPQPETDGTEEDMDDPPVKGKKGQDEDDDLDE